MTETEMILVRWGDRAILCHTIIHLMRHVCLNMDKLYICYRFLYHHVLLEHHCEMHNTCLEWFRKWIEMESEYFQVNDYLLNYI